MSAVHLEIALIVLLVGLNGVLSMSEIAIVSARKARLQQLADDGHRGARVALDLANDPDPLLATVQVGITLVGILAGAFGGATLAEQLAAWLQRLGWMRATSETVAVVVVVVGITYLSVVVGELAPKKLALSRPEQIAAVVARPMRLLSRLAFPAVRLLNASTRLLFAALRVKPSDTPAVTEDEIRVLVRQGATLGLFGQIEHDIVDRVLRLGGRRVSALMTPRTEAVWIDLDDPPALSLATMAASDHAFVPACRGDIDHIVGVVSTRALWVEAVQGRPVDLAASLQPPLFVPANASALRVLEMFRQAATPVALVVDEYGGFLGLVTLNDVLGAIVGDVALADVHDEPEIVRREDGSWLLDGMLPWDDFKAALGLRGQPGAEVGRFQTVGGFIMDRLARVPREGDHFAWNDLRFEVVDMDGRRVDKVLVSRLR